MFILRLLILEKVWGNKMDKLIVREAKLKDAKNIAKVHVKTWQQIYKGQIPQSYLDNLSVGKRTEGWVDILTDPKSKSETFVAVINKNVVGFCSIGPSRNKDSQNTGEVYSIYIDQKFSGKGIGTALIQKGLDFLKRKGFKKAILWVLVSNKKGRKFYESRGWKAESKVKEDKIGGVKVEEISYYISISKL